jgi:hypothetical protein
MTLLSAITNFTLRAATVVFSALVTLVTLLALDRLGVQFYFDPVAQVLGAAGFTARCLCRGSTPRQEIQRIFGH